MGADAESLDSRCGCYSEAHNRNHRNLLTMYLGRVKPGRGSLVFVCEMDPSWQTWKHRSGRLGERLNLDSDVMGGGERRKL